MSNWLGSGYPQFLIDGAVYSYPHTVADGRTEEWVPEIDEVWTNVLGDLRFGRTRYRFQAEYTWRGLTDAQVRQLIQWRNQKQLFTLRPYSDLGVYQILCIIEDVTPSKGPVVTAQDVLTVRVKAYSLVDSRPIPDTRIYGFYHPMKGVV